MLQSSEQQKTCPLLAAFATNKDQVSTGSTWASRCKGTDCAWWDTEKDNCVVSSVCKSVAHLLAAG